MRKPSIPVILLTIFLVSFGWYQIKFQDSLRNLLWTCFAPTTNQEQPLMNQSATPPKTELQVQIGKSTPPPKTKLQLEVDAIFEKIEKLIPKVSFTNFNQTTNGRNSKISIVNPQETYCVGDDFVVRVDMFDHLGNRKTYGGDFLRPRLFSLKLGASISGTVEDFKNGSYQVHFPLYWAGNANVTILLFHPSEGVAALWRSRHSSQGFISFQGRYEKFGKEAVSKCGFRLSKENGKEICEYKDPLYEEVLHCYKAPNFTCESLKDMSGTDIQVSYLTPVEQQIFQRSNTAVLISRQILPIKVIQCGNETKDSKPKCQTGMSSPLPSGYFYDEIWNPIYCNMTVYRLAENFTNCLQGKNLFLIGDSTLRQFIMHFTEELKIVKYFRYHYKGWAGWPLTLEAMNMEKDTYVSYKRHGFPLQHDGFYYFKEDLYTSRQIDQRVGGKDTIFVITMGQHFRQFPLKVFIQRAINIRRAIERLFLRSPDTKVIIKTENTRDVFTPAERQGDFHGYTQYLVLKEVFQGINVGFVDAWDMTVASATASVHPPSYTFANIMSLTLTFAC